MMGFKPVTICVAAAVMVGWWCLLAAAQSTFEGPLLSTFKGVTQTASQGPQGSYKFSFSLPQQKRVEHRDEQGKVTGDYSFVDRAGREVSVTYDADHKGFRARSDSLPQPPQDTPDVAKAKEEFLRHYERTARLLRVLEEEEEEGEGEEEDSRSSEEDEESGEDSDEDDDEDGDSSSEEGTSSDEDEEDKDYDDDDNDEEEEDNEEDEENDEEKDDNLERGLEHEEENETEDEEEGNGKRIQEEEEQENNKRQVELRLIDVSLPGRPKIPLPLPVHVRERTGRRFTVPTSFLPPLTLTQTNQLSGSLPQRQ